MHFRSKGIAFAAVLALVACTGKEGPAGPAGTKGADGQNGTQAITRVLIETHNGKSIWHTVGASTNIIEASWWALADSVEYGLMKLVPEGQAHGI